MAFNLLAVLILCGCEGLNVQKQSFVALPGEKMLRDVSVAEWPGDIGQAREALVLAMRQSHWGVLRLEWTKPDEAAVEPSETEEEPLVRGWGILPGGRTTVAAVWSGEEEGCVRAAVRVGRMGDQRLERDFLITLEAVMSGKPAPTRDAGFKLPPNY